MSSYIEFENEKTCKQLCSECHEIEETCPKCGKVDSCLYSFIGKDNINYTLCLDCCPFNPCERCGKQVDLLVFEHNYGKCDICYGTDWCSKCDKAQSVYFDSPSDVFYSGFCLDCLIKIEFDISNCECGVECKFYSKDDNKWLCIDCVIAKKQ